MKTKLIAYGVIGILSAAVIGMGWFIWQTENYMKSNDAWKVNATATVNNNTQNIMTIGSYLQAQADKVASSTKK